jgi:hypothetical protein
MLQSSMEQCLQWYVSLADSFAIYGTQEGIDLQQREQQKQQTHPEAFGKAIETYDSVQRLLDREGATK